MPGQPPAVSVLITTHNGGALLEQAIASVLVQGFADFDVLVVDDASTDDTPARLAAIADPRLTVLRNPVNLGVVGARNRGVALCCGRYLAVLDHDDLAAPGRLAAQVAVLEAEPALVAVAAGTAMLRDGRMVGEAQDRPLGPDELGFLLHLGNPLTWSSMMLRMAAVRRLPVFCRAEYELADDYDLYHRLLKLGPMRRIGGRFCFYRWHAANLTLQRAALLDARAVAVLADALTPHFGVAAAAMADGLIRHVSNRQVPEDAAGLRDLGDTLMRVFVAYADAHPAASRGALAALAGREWWRSVAGAARRGAPGMLRLWRTQPTLAAWHRPGARAWIETLAISRLRRATRR